MSYTMGILRVDVNEYLDKLFTKFNLKHPLLYKGPSLSVGDVIEITNGCYKGAYFCDSFGFGKVDEFYDKC